MEYLTEVHHTCPNAHHGWSVESKWEVLEVAQAIIARVTALHFGRPRWCAAYRYEEWTTDVQVRTFNPMTRLLLVLPDRVTSVGARHVVMEATSLAEIAT